MMRAAFVVVVLWLSLPESTYGQPRQYEDANNVSQAIGQMKNMEWTAEALEKECEARFPEKRPAFEGNIKKWRTSDAHEIEIADYYFDQGAKEDPSLLGLRKQSMASIENGIKSLEAANPGKKESAVMGLCQQRLSEYASGTWRQRTPNVYKFLDAATLPH